MITASIVNFNEGNKLASCLESIEDFVDEIIILDLGSSDNSIEIAKKFSAKVYKQRQVDYVEKVRNFVISKANGDWILILDPDEILTLELKNKLKEIVKQNNFEAVNIPRKNIFFGKWIAHSNWWPDRHIRFFKKGQVEWHDKIHSYPKIKGQTLNLPANENLAIRHFGYDDFSQFLIRQNRYSNVEAKNKFSAGERFSWLNFFWWPIREFLVRFIKHQGYLDGFYGFSLIFFMMVYKLSVSIKLWELEKK